MEDRQGQQDSNGVVSNNNTGNATGQAAPPGQASAAPTLMSSFFPSPPSHYTQFSDENLNLARRLVASPSFSTRTDSSPCKDRQATILAELGLDQDEIERVKDLDLASLVDPPDIQLIEEDGHWQSFGQAWPIHEALPSLEEMGVKQLYNTPTTFEGRRKALHSLLHTLLHTYLRLLTILTSGPPSLIHEEAAFNASPNDPSAFRTQADSIIEHIRLTAINIHHLCNEWRPVQARETMRLMIRNQIEQRRERMEEMREAMGEIRERLEGLKTRVNRGDPENLVETVQAMELGEEGQEKLEVKPEKETLGKADVAVDRHLGDRKAAASRRMLATLDELT